MSELDLLIIHPNAVHGIYGELGESLVAVEPPLWARLIAGYVRDRGFSVKIIDAEAEKFSSWKVAKLVNQEKPRLICLAVYGHQPSASTQQMVGASEIATDIKALCGEAQTIIMVGGHVSALPERTLREEAIDYACVGEGPATVVGLLTALTRGGIIYPQQILGLVWWDGSGLVPDRLGEPRVNPSAPLIDLKELHGNAWDLLPMDKYRAHNWQTLGAPGMRQPYASIYTSLNCPYKCSFCCISAPFQNNIYRMRDPKDVVTEILILYNDYGVKTFKIIDEMFILNEKHYTAIAQGLIASRIAHDLNIWAYARVDTVKPKTLKMLRQAGFRWLALGIESGSKYVRDGADKALKNDDIVATVRAIESAGISVIANYIFGLPDDNYASMQQTLNLALELNTDFSNFYAAMAYPGSKLYTEALATRPQDLPENWAGYSQHNKYARPLCNDKLHAKDILAFRDAAFLAYFENPRYLDKIQHHYGIESVEMIKQMTSYKLERNLLKAPEAA